MDYNYVNIDSKFVKNKISDSNFTFTFDNEIKNVIEINMSSIEIPNSSFLFQNFKDNTHFKLTINNNEYKFYLIEGNYRLNTLYDLINSFLLDIESKNNGVNLGIIFNPDSVRFKFVSNTSFSLYFTNNSNYKSLGEILGFSKKEYTNITEVESENMPDITNNKYFYLKLSEFGNILNNNMRYFTKIIVTKGNYEPIFESKNIFLTKKFIMSQPTNLKSLNISIHDFNNNIVNFNGVNVSLTLEIKSIKNNLFKKYYEKFNYDSELMDLILKDKMLTYFTNKSKKNNINVGNKVINVMSDIHNKKLYPQQEELKLENEPKKIVTAEEKAIIKHKKKIKNKKKRLKEQFKY